jgi:hypothetical protein
MSCATTRVAPRSVGAGDTLRLVSKAEVDEYGYLPSQRAFSSGKWWDGRSREDKVAFFEQAVSSGSVTIRYSCPVEGCGGPHPRSEHVYEDDPEAVKVALSYLDPVTRRRLQGRLRSRRYRERQRNGRVAA